MIDHRWLRRAAAGLVLAAACLSAPVVAQTQAPTPVPAPPAQATAFRLDGFRSAAFGMTDAQLRAAIRRDFAAAADKIVAAESPVDRTTTLTITVPDLLQGSGPCQVVYVLGFTTKKLIQVSVVWGGPANPALKNETAVAMANQLRNYFMGVGYKAESVVANAPNADGSFTVFQGSDSGNRVTRLTLVGGDTAAGANARPPTLSLVYALDPVNPDIFRIPRGQF